MAPRSIWSGAITFGLVNVPVRMYSAIQQQDVHFHLLHTKDDSRIGYDKVCKREGKRVPDDEIAKAYEFSDGEFVYMTDEDFAAAEGETYRTIEILDFVPYEEIDPIYFEQTYYLGPAENAEKVYSLLLQAMEQSGLAAIVRYVMREKQHIGCLRIREGTITLERMYFADEIRDVAEVKPRKARVDKRELEMAAQLIDRFTGSFDPTKYEDTYRKSLLEIVEAKRKGKDVHHEPRTTNGEPIDLLAALRESLEQQTARGTRKGATNGGSGLESLTKSELDERARKAGIKGRSAMSKAELVSALADG
jgi:DNA end-binding protein Ku